MRDSARVSRAFRFYQAPGNKFSLDIANGFSRFAYALLLPSMRDAFGWSHSTAG